MQKKKDVYTEDFPIVEDLKEQLYKTLTLQIPKKVPKQLNKCLLTENLILSVIIDSFFVK